VDNLFPLLLFVIFILAPLIEQLRKRGQPPPPPPPTRRPLPQRPEQRSETEEVSSQRAEPASTMIPDELWQILTGEQRVPELPQPQQPPPQSQQPAPAKPSWDVSYVPPEAEEDEESRVGETLNAQVERMRREEVALQQSRRRPVAATLEEVPVIVSLEKEPLAQEARHTAFHDKMMKREQPTPVRRRKSFLALNSREELQRAFVLREVLGKPRGLE
jgi:hypothetical protein